MSEFARILYDFILWRCKRDALFTVTYKQIASWYGVEMYQVYAALNTLASAKGLKVEAVKCLGNGDYEVRFA